MYKLAYSKTTKIQYIHAIPCVVLSLFFSFPARVAGRTQVNIIYVYFVITDVNNLARCILGICSAIWVWAQDSIVPGKCGVKFCVFIDNMSKCLFALINIRLTYTNVICVQLGRFIAALPAVINQFIRIIRVNPNVIHILAYITEVHVISYILC
jgi:hypothetical protein